MALAPLRAMRMQPDQRFRVPFVPIQIEKGVMTTIVKFAAITEAHALGAIFGEHKVTVLPIDPVVHGARFHEATFDEEHGRLEAKFGINPNTGVSYVEEAYGRRQQSMLGQFMEENHSDAPAQISLVEQRQVVAPPQNNRSQGVPDDEVPEVNIDKALDQQAQESEAQERKLSTKRECIEYLTSLGVHFSASSHLSTLRVLASNCQDIEQLGYEVPRGADAEDIDRILDQVRDAADGGVSETDNVQSLLEQAAGQSIPE